MLGAIILLVLIGMLLAIAISGLFDEIITKLKSKKFKIPVSKKIRFKL